MRPSKIEAIEDAADMMVKMDGELRSGMESLRVGDTRTMELEVRRIVVQFA